jgi:hypothetical protein
MARCDVCGNDYDGGRIIGHGVQAGERISCCSHRAGQEGQDGCRVGA